MRAVVLEADRSLRMDDRPDPSPGRGEVLVDLATSGICGTDLSIYSGKIAVRHPRVLGHEMFGHVASSDGGAAAGTRVVIDPVLSCGVCYWCSKGQTNLCPNGALLGRDRDGGFAERIAVPQSNVYEVPASISDEVAPLVQVLTVCVHAQRDAPVFPGDSVLVLGLGVSGLLHLQIARARGAAPLIGVTRSASKRELAESLGADLTFDPGDSHLGERVAEATGGRGPDVVIESAGRVETLAAAIGLVRPGGHIVLFGTITEDRGALPFYSLYLKELTITNPRAAKPEDFPAAIDLAGSGRVRLAPLISDTFPLEETGAAIEATAESGTLKIILDHGGVRS
ncbi:MAG: alcohol dehydrogenase catalytic domain-containing protein [Actinobacteria bacterium]|nr:alcohol dehydrogenase catalytic domain-containing protein [Actinomycetota bacterium]